MVYWAVMKQWAKQKAGFTIVELLIVIVVIAILAAITIVAYNGITGRSKASALQSDLSQASKALESKKLMNGEVYPADLESVNATSDKLTYHYNSRSNTYCIDAKDGEYEYSVRGTTLKVEEGSCIERGLALWLPFNGNANDASGNENGINTYGTPTLTTGADGRANGAYYLNGTNQYFSLQSPDSIPARTDRFTVSVWAKGASVVGNDYAYIVHKGYNTSIGSSVLYLGTNTGVAQILTASANGQYNAGNTGVGSDGSTWRHIVLVYAGGVQTTYVDGVRAGGEDTIGEISNPTSGTTFTIGAGVGGYRDFIGAIDDVRVYHRALTDDEVANLHQAGAQ